MSLKVLSSIPWAILIQSLTHPEEASVISMLNQVTSKRLWQPISRGTILHILTIQETKVLVQMGVSTIDLVAGEDLQI